MMTEAKSKSLSVVRNLTYPSTLESTHSSQSMVMYHVPEQRSITAFRAAAKSLIQGKPNTISAYRSATARLPSSAPVSAITTSQGSASRRGRRDFKHRSRQRISFLKMMPMDSRGFDMANLSFLF